MGLISLNLRYNPPATPTPEPLANTKASLDDWFRQTTSGTETVGLAENSSQRALLAAFRDWVYSAASMVANRMMSLKWTLALERRVNGEVKVVPVDSHPFYSLMEAQNPVLNYEELVELMWLHRLLAGNAYWYLDRSGPYRTPVGVYPIKPDQMCVIYNERTFERRYIWIGNEAVQAFDSDEIIHFKQPNPSNLFFGMGVVESQIYAYDVGLHNLIYQKNFYKNSARPDYVLAYPKNVKLDRPTLKLVWDMLKERHQGVDKAHLPAIFGDGATPVFPPASNTDARAIAISNMTRDKIFVAFGVPPSKIDQLANRANADAADVSFNRDCILPKLVKFKAELERQFLNRCYPQKNGILRINFDNPVAADADLLMRQEEHDLKLGLLNRDELRAARNLPPLDDGSGSTYYLMTGLVPADVAGMMMPGSPGEGAGGVDGEAPPANEDQQGATEGEWVLEESRGEDEAAGKAVSGPSVKNYKNAPRAVLWRDARAVRAGGEGLPDGLKAALWSHHLKVLDRHEPGFARALEKFFAEQRERVVAAVEANYGKILEATAGLPSCSARLKAARRKGLLDVTVYFEKAREERLACRVGAKHILRGNVDAFSATFDDIVEGADRRPRPRPRGAKGPESAVYRVVRIVHDWANRKIRRYGEGITETTAEAISRVIAKGTAEGLTLNDVAGMIRNLFDETFAKHRPKMIARTELNGAANAGTIQAYRESGVTEGKQWLSAMDERTRTFEDSDFDHAIDQVVKIDEPFTDTGEPLDAPGDPSGSPGNIINCRCTTVAVLPDHYDMGEIDPNLTADVQAEIFANFDEWLNEEFPEEE